MRFLNPPDFVVSPRFDAKHDNVGMKASGHVTLWGGAECKGGEITILVWLKRFYLDYVSIVQRLFGTHSPALIMKNLFVIIFSLIISSIAFSQDTVIYRVVFGDTSIFSQISEIGRPRPAEFKILANSISWKSYRFYLPEVLGLSNHQLSKIQFDEHHPFEHSYIFKDTSLNSLFPDSIKIRLRDISLSLKQTKITISGTGFNSVQSMKNRTGYYAKTTRPVYSSDYQYAFIDFDICYKEKLIPDNSFDFEPIINFLYILQMQSDGSWKIIKRIKHVYG
jgi:hypothetical protein